MPTDRELISLVQWNLEHADTDNQLLRETIERSDDYYFGRLPGPAPTGRSSAVALEVQTMCTAVSAELVQGFTSDQPAAFEPAGDGDDRAAELESYAITSVLEDNHGYQLYCAGIDSALRYGLAAAKVTIQDRTTTETERLPGATAEEAAALLAQLPEDIDATITKADDDEIVVEIMQQGQELKVEPIDISLLKYKKDWGKPEISDIPFIAIQYNDTRRADLIEMFPSKRKVIEDLPASMGGSGALYDEATRSKLVGEERSFEQADSKENDLIIWFEVWQEVPTTGGKTERRHIAVSNWSLLMDELWEGAPPIAVGTAFPQPHRLQGVSLAAKLFDIQDRASIAQRQLEDNLDAGNLNRTSGYDVEIGDVTSGRANGHVRLLSPNSIFNTHAPVDSSSQSLQYLAFMKNQRSERAGSALDLQSAESQLMDSQIGAVASQQLIGHQEQMSQYISQNLGETYVRNLWLTIHEQLRLRFDGQITVRVADQFVEVSPRDWSARTRLTLKAGMSPSARNRKAANLMQVVQVQLGLLQQGAPLTDLNGVHAALRDWGIASDLDSINTYLIDPQSQTGQAMAQASQQQAQQQQEQQQQIMQLQAQLEQTDRQINKQKADDDRWKDEQDVRFNYWKETQENERTEATLVANAITQSAPDQGAEGSGSNGAGQGG